jgi:diketogulonate reductase-like aldo/keto reductase
MKKAANKSLKRLGINNFDLYLIHFPSPLTSRKKQMKILDHLVKEGKTRYVGVSNFSVEQFREGLSFLNAELVTNQLHSNITKQHHISESLPYYQEKGVTLTAYSPLGHKGYSNLKKELKGIINDIATTHSATIQQIAIAWLLNHKNVIAIPKAFHIEHVEANAKAAEIILSEKELKLIENSVNS